MSTALYGKLTEENLTLEQWKQRKEALGDLIQEVQGKRVERQEQRIKVLERKIKNAERDFREMDQRLRIMYELLCRSDRSVEVETLMDDYCERHPGFGPLAGYEKVNDVVGWKKKGGRK